jgi:hypothetical protein
MAVIIGHVERFYLVKWKNLIKYRKRLRREQLARTALIYLTAHAFGADVAADMLREPPKTISLHTNKARRLLRNDAGFLQCIKGLVFNPK